MKRKFGGVFGLFLWMAGCAVEANGQAAVRPAPEELMAITERGTLLNEYDQAAWHATDAVETANPKTVEGQRSIAKKENGRWVVVFGKLNVDKSRFEIAYETLQQEKPQVFAVSKEPRQRQAEGFYLFAGRALEIAVKDFGRMNRPYNVAVLPAPNEQLYVYLYPAQTKPRVYPLGGDVRYLFSSDGTKIVEKRQMHKSVFENPSATGKKLVGGVHTHVLSDLPEDTDVFHVLTQDPHLPEMVGTPHFMYQVRADGTITIVKEKK